MADDRKDHEYDAQAVSGADPEPSSTLLPMLVAGILLIVLGMFVVISFT